MLNEKIDHEEYKVKIKVSDSTYFLLKQDMFRFGFIKTNEEANVNLFINYVLPIMYLFRLKQNDSLKSKLNNLNIKEDTIENIVETTNNFYNEDDISYHNEIINIRISTKNMDIFSFLFKDKSKKKSTFLRSLINQYTNLKLDIREFLFFNDNYHLVEKAMKKKYIVKFIYNENEVFIFPIDIDTCPIDSEIFIFGISNKNGKLFINAFKLCDMNNLCMTNKAFDIKISDNMKKIIKEFIIDLKYLENDCELLGGI